MGLVPDKNMDNLNANNLNSAFPKIECWSLSRKLGDKMFDGQIQEAIASNPNSPDRQHRHNLRRLKCGKIFLSGRYDRS